MGRLIERHPEELERKLRRSAKRDAALVDWLTQEVEDAFSARRELEESWVENLRMYEGVPKVPIKNVPIENAPNIEVTIGAVAADSIFAQALELIFAINPVVTTRPTLSDPETVQDAKAMQRFLNWGSTNEFHLRQAAEQVLLDDVQLGTGVYYIPWIEAIKHTDLGRVIDIGPRLFGVPIEDFLTPGGAYADPQLMPWCAYRTWPTSGEIEERRRRRKWDTSGFAATGNVSWMRTRRENLGRTHGQAGRTASLYEVLEIYCYFDYDNDGAEEDLLVIWDRTSRTIGWMGYNPYDRRPFEPMRYQLRPWLFNGLGVLEMLRPYQDEITENHNQRNLNARLANTRMWKARTGAIPTGQMIVYENKVVELQDPNELMELKLSDVYPSSAGNEMLSIALAEKRSGVQELSSKQAAPLTSSRTPGITALSFIQQQNRRFAPAFDAMRLATAGAVTQCMYRYRERLLAGDRLAEQNIMRVLGPEDAERVVRVLKTPGFEEAITVELTASSSSVNREAERQNALLLVNMLGQYYQQTLQLVSVAADPNTPEMVREVAAKIATSAGELMDRTIRTFDQLRDPASFILELQEDFDKLATEAPVMNPIQQLLGGLLGGDGGGEQSGGAPGGPPGITSALPNSGGGAV
jgi:hypothetical protein